MQKNKKNELCPIILDTHSWFWLVTGENKFQNSDSGKLIDNAMLLSKLVVSSISVWEIAMLESKGRLRFSIPCKEWIYHALDIPGLSIENLSPEISVESTRLPGEFHGDPADRIIVATTRFLNGILITQDESILNYSSLNYLKTKKAF